MKRSFISVATVLLLVVSAHAQATNFTYRDSGTIDFRTDGAEL